MGTSLKIISILKSFSYTSTDNSFTPSQGSDIADGVSNIIVCKIDMKGGTDNEKEYNCPHDGRRSTRT